MKLDVIEKLAAERNEPCLSFSLRTHRTFPDCQQDDIALKNLCKEAESRVLTEYDKRAVAPLLEKLNRLNNEIEENKNLDSLYIFLSNDTFEFYRSPFPVSRDEAQISTSFALKPLIRDLNRTEDYYIMAVSQSGIHLYNAVNDHIEDEVHNTDFPFKENRHYITDSAQKSNAKAVDDQLREFLNKVDKALVRAHNESGKHCVVISTEDNFSKLLQVADKQDVYYGHESINYNDVSDHTLAAQAWKVVGTRHFNQRKDAISEMEEAIGHGKVITDLQEIYTAAKEGRGALLVANHDFRQAVKLTGTHKFDLVDDAKAPGVVDDITSEIAREVIMKKGRVVFTGQDELDTIGSIALKVRY